MTNKERQSILDKDKWFKSKELGRDLSGARPYCLCCPHATPTHNCYVKQKDREEQCLCAKAYNKLQKRMNYGKH